MRKIIFSTTEKAEMWANYKKGIPTGVLGKKYECSHQTICRNLKQNFGKEYTRIAKNHCSEAAQKICRKTGLLPKTKKQLEACRKMGQNNNGEKHPNWKGGISRIEFEKAFGISGEEWKSLAQIIRKRDKFICQYCGKKRATSVHHIIPRRITIDNHPDNLITLCRSCHNTIEKLTDKYLKEMGII